MDLSTTTNRAKARVAGVVYLVVVATGIFSLAYVPGRIIVVKDAAATLRNIAENEALFRMGLAAGVICYAAFLFLPLALHRLLSPVNKNAATLMVVCALASVPISLANLSNKLNLLPLVGENSQLQALSAGQISAQAALTLNAYSHGVLIAEVFWGLWLLPFGYLVYKSGFLPKLLGILLMIGCFGYQADVFGRILVPGFRDFAFTGWLTLPAGLGEMGSCLWLLVLGAREVPTKPGRSIPL